MPCAVEAPKPIGWGCHVGPARRGARLTALTLAVAGWTASAHAVSFQVVDLGTLAPGATSMALGLNNVGQVVGVSTVGGRKEAFVWSAGTGMVSIFGSSGSSAGDQAHGINDDGTVVGVSGNSITTAAFVWSPTLGTSNPAAGTSLSLARGINAAGQIAGTATPASGARNAFVTGKGGIPMQYVGTLGGTYGEASALNDAGQVVGGSATASDGYHAFVWSAGSGMRDLGALSSADSISYATGINNRGQVVGTSYDYFGNRRAFLWDDGNGMRPLSTLGPDSLATGINDAGQVVGWTAATGSGTPSGAFLYATRDGIVDLNTRLATPGAARINLAAAINKAGDIVGQDANQHAVLLRAGGDLAWRGVSGARWSEVSNWELGFAPDARFDVQIQTTGAQTITLDRDTLVNSLALGGASGGRATLLLADGNTLTARYGATVGATGTLTGDGRVAGAVVNLGTVQGAQLHVEGGITNLGLVTAGPGSSPSLPSRLMAGLDNQGGGQLRVGTGEALLLAGSAHRNAGTFEVRGGELTVHGALLNEAGGRVLVDGGTLRLADGITNRGDINVGFGGASVFGDVEQVAGGKIILSGRSEITFYDGVDIGAGSELRVSAGSTALFFGKVEQRSGALFTGTGTKFYEGGFEPGAAPSVARDEGSVAFGAGNVLLADIGGAAAGGGEGGHDRLLVSNSLHFGGTLKLLAFGSFAAQAGQRFDLFDWGSSSGTFSNIDASGLGIGDGLVLDTSQLYIDGSVSITAMPEPATWLSLLSGLSLGLALLRRCRSAPPQVNGGIPGRFDARRGSHAAAESPGTQRMSLAR